jgi:hypothetical protein
MYVSMYVCMYVYIRIFGIALLEWAGVRGGLPLIVALAAWVFACR